MAEEANFFASSIILDRKTRLETHSDITLVEGNGVGRCCGCSGGLLLGESHPSSDTCPGGDSTRGRGRAEGASSAVASRHANSTSLGPHRGRREGGAGEV
jgi:hypothetical protein